MSKYVVVTESGGDIPANLAEQYGIKVVPMHVTIGDVSYDDGTIAAQKLFDYYQENGELPRTSGCTPGDFENVFSEIFAEQPDAHIIYLAYSAQTTCSFESAMAARAGNEAITCIDTMNVTAGQCLIVTEIARAIEANPDIEVAQIEELATDLIKRSRMSFVPGGLEFLRAGGRLSNAAFLGAQLLRIKPVIEILDGKLVATKKLHGSMRRVIKAMLKDVLEREPLSKERICFVEVDGLARELMDLAESEAQEHGFKSVEWVHAGAVISSHSGPGSFGVAYFAK